MKMVYLLIRIHASDLVSHTFVFSFMNSLLKHILVRELVMELNLHTCSWIVVGKILNNRVLQEKEFDRLFVGAEARVWLVEAVKWSPRNNHELVLKSLFLGKSPMELLLFQVPLVIYINYYDGS